MLLISCLILSHYFSFANSEKIQKASPEQIKNYRSMINHNTITILGASLSGSYIKIVDDIAKAVNDGHKLRVIPIIGEGGSQNIRDILYLNGIDAGIVMSTSREAYKKNPFFSDLKNKLQYIARLYDEEFHIIAYKKINSIQDLKGKIIGFHGGAYISGQLLLEKLNIEPKQSLKINFFQGLEKIKTGEISAIVRATARPMKGFNTSYDPNFHKLLPIPFDVSLSQSYSPAKLTHKDYPNIIKPGEETKTVAIGVILATSAHKPNTDRYRRVSQFTNAFFSNFQNILKDKKRHPKWNDINLAAKISGWKRFEPAQKLIDQMNRKSPLKY